MSMTAAEAPRTYPTRVLAITLDCRGNGEALYEGRCIAMCFARDDGQVALHDIKKGGPPRLYPNGRELIDAIEAMLFALA